MNAPAPVSLLGLVGRTLGYTALRVNWARPNPSPGLRAIGAAILIAAVLLLALGLWVARDLAALNRHVRSAPPGTPWSSIAAGIGEAAEQVPLSIWPRVGGRLRETIALWEQDRAELHNLLEAYDATRDRINTLSVEGRASEGTPTARDLHQRLEAMASPMLRGSLGFAEIRDALEPYTTAPGGPLGTALVEAPPGHLLALEFPGRAPILLAPGAALPRDLGGSGRATLSAVRENDRTVAETLEGVAPDQLLGLITFPSSGLQFRIGADAATRARYPELPALSAAARAEASVR